MNHDPNPNYRDDSRSEETSPAKSSAKSDSQQETLRQELLELHYGLLEPAEEALLRKRIATESDVAIAWAETLAIAGKFATAAKVTTRPESLARPRVAENIAENNAENNAENIKTNTSARLNRSSRFLRIWLTSLASAATLAIAISGVRYFGQRPSRPSIPLQVAVEPIAGSDASVRNEFLVLVRQPSESFSSSTKSTNLSFDASAPIVPASISYQVLAKGIVLFRGATEVIASKPCRIQIPDDLVIPSNATLVVSAAAIGSEASSGSAVALSDNENVIRISVPLEPTRCLTYVTTDRPVYRPGETVYFRSVTLNRRTLASHVEVPVRFELLDASGSAVKDAASEGVTERGVGNGSFVIPESAAGGSYKLVAKSLDGFFPDQACDLEVRRYRAVRLKTKLEFSKRSFGANEDVQADLSVRRADDSIAAGALVKLNAIVDGKDVYTAEASLDSSGALGITFKLPAVIREGKGILSAVINDGSVVETAARPIPIHTGRAQVEFYPEGGYLVGGIENRVYFAARDIDGNPIEVAGEVLSQSGYVVADAKTVRDGMGRFSFKPETGQRYSLRVTSPIDITETPWLPSVVEALPVLDTGLGVFDDGDPITLTIRSTRRRDVMVRAVCRGELVGVQLVELGVGETDVEMPIQEKARGVIRVTVLESKAETEQPQSSDAMPIDTVRINTVPLVERLVFRRGNKHLNIATEIENAKASYAPGDSVRMTLRVTDEHGKPYPGASLGVAVVDDTALSLRQHEQPTIATHFMLTSEVESPEDLEHANFYLNEGDDAAESLDLLLGTQGWRRFVSGTETQNRESLRASLTRLLQLDGNRDALLGETQSNDADFASHLRHYTMQMAAIWKEFIADIRFALLVIGLVWFLAFLCRPKQELVAAASLLLLGSLLLAQSGCGSAENQVISASADREMNVPGRSIAEMEDGAAAEKTARQENDDAGSVSEPAVKSDQPKGKDSFAKQVIDTLLQGQGGRGDLDNSVSRLSKEQLARWSKSREVDAQALADQLMEQLRFPIRQYAHLHRPSESNTRSDFTETLYWNPMMVTDSRGTASIRFDLSDSLTLFRVNIDAHSRDGRLGSGSGAVTTQLPLQVEPKLPLEVTSGDRIDLPVGIVNASDQPMVVNLKLDADAGLETQQDQTALSIAGHGRTTERFSINVSDYAKPRESKLTVSAAAESGFADSVERSIRIVPSGFPFSESQSGKLDTTASVSISLPEQTVSGSLAGSLRFFPSTQSQLSAGMESVLREPHGCFEQTSASNYPNVLAFELMTLDGVVDQSMKSRTESLLRRGYRKLVQYECSSGGFEWFGNGPGHEALTAFGLMQFAEMSRFITVDQKMIQRSHKWLLSRRDGRGGFHRNPRHLHSWAVDQDTVNAYVLWTLSEADRSLGGTFQIDETLSSEIDVMRQVAEDSRDNYLIALSARTLRNLDQGDVANRLADRLVSQQDEDGHLEGDQTITDSGGISRTVETTALAVLAWSTDPKYQSHAIRAVEWLSQNRRGGGFGSTQASVLALKAMVSMQDKLAGEDGGSVTIRVDGKTLDKVTWTGRPSEGIAWPLPRILLAEKGSGLFFELSTSNGKPLSYAVDVTGRTLAPKSDSHCPLELSVAFAESDSVIAGDTIEVVAKLTNKTDVGQPMSLAVIGLPGGVEPVIESLDRMREADEIAYYEIRGREVVLYWRSIKPRDEKELRIPVVAQIPGRYTGPPSRSYLYYTAESKCWNDPLVVEID